MSIQSKTFHKRATRRLAAEYLLILAALATSVSLQGRGAWTDVVTRSLITRMVLSAGVWQLCLYFAGIYESNAYSSRQRLLVRLVQGSWVAWMVLALCQRSSLDARALFLDWVLVLSFVGTWRLITLWASANGKATERLLMLGVNGQTLELATYLAERRVELGVEIVGFVDPDSATVGGTEIDPRIIGTVDDIPRLVRSHHVTRVVVSMPDARGKLPMDQLLAMKLGGVRFDHFASVYEDYTGKIAVEHLRPSWLVFSAGFETGLALRGFKRLLDVAVSLAGLVFAFPVFALTAAAIKLTSQGPILFHQPRVGRGGRVFNLHKFRSMRPDAEAETGAIWARYRDDRVTAIGAFLRRTRLDELPQLWNVLRGEMSLVGPRPERPEFVDELARQIPFYGERHIITPGLTGWAQVRQPYGASVDDALEKLRFDLFYVKNMTLLLDGLILFETIKTVIFTGGSAAPRPEVVTRYPLDPSPVGARTPGAS